MWVMSAIQRTRLVMVSSCLLCSFPFIILACGVKWESETLGGVEFQIRSRFEGWNEGLLTSFSFWIYSVWFSWSLCSLQNAILPKSTIASFALLRSRSRSRCSQTQTQSPRCRYQAPGTQWCPHLSIFRTQLKEYLSFLILQYIVYF